MNDGFTFLSWAIFGVGFMLGHRDNTAHKIRQTLEGSNVRRFGLYRFCFLPLRGHASRRRRGGILADQLAIGQATTGYGSEGRVKTACIIVLAGIEAKDLLIEVAE